MRNICVFCGSQSGTDQRYGKAAVELGELLAQRGYGWCMAAATSA